MRRFEMKIVDLNDWDYEVEFMEILNKTYKNTKIFCISLRVVAYVICLVCLGIFAQTFYDITNKENLFLICSIALLVSTYAKEHQKKLKKYEIKNLVFCILDEETFIDAKYIKESSNVAITFRDITNGGTIEEFLVDCDVRVDEEVEEDTLIIYPNRADMILCGIEEMEEEE